MAILFNNWPLRENVIYDGYMRSLHLNQRVYKISLFAEKFNKKN